MPLLSSILLCPLVTLVVVLCTPARAVGFIRWVCALGALAATVLSAQLWLTYDGVTGGLQFVEERGPAFGKQRPLIGGGRPPQKIGQVPVDQEFDLRGHRAAVVGRELVDRAAGDRQLGGPGDAVEIGEAEGA